MRPFGFEATKCAYANHSGMRHMCSWLHAKSLGNSLPLCQVKLYQVKVIAAQAQGSIALPLATCLALS